MAQTLKEKFKYKTIKSYQGLYGRSKLIDNEVLLGVEVELEKVQKDYTPNTWTFHIDDSLKIQGAEFVSIPIKFGFLEVELERLFEALATYDASNRCSIHVHMNVQDFTEEELYKLLILYVIFEKSLFRVSGNRWKSNFCTPLYNDSNTVRQFMFNPYQTWYKYFALNLLPIWGCKEENSNKYGTVEFRHHIGCTSPKEIINWCNLIVGLRQAAKKFSLEELILHIRTMNTTSAYFWLCKEVFLFCHDKISGSLLFKEEVESCITKSKIIFFDNDGEFIPFIMKPVFTEEAEI